jgi:hypothetical protein
LSGLDAALVQPIATFWPDLPKSFQQRVDGAADVNGSLYLFKAGRYVNTAADVSTAARLTAIKGWPSSGAWADGIVDLVGSGHGESTVVFIRHDEVLVADMARSEVIWGPTHVDQGFGGDLLAGVTSQGLDTLLYDGTVQSSNTEILAFGGPSVTKYTGSMSPAESAGYLGLYFNLEALSSTLWPSTWNPIFAQGPAGRVHDMWTYDVLEGSVVRYDGRQWSALPLPSNARALSVSAGTDGTVMAVGGSTLYRLDTSGAVPSWQAAGAVPGGTQQVTVGDATHAWVRDQSGNVFSTTDMSQVDLGGQAVDLGASYDGSIWHCDGSSSNTFRYIGGAQSQTLAVAPANGAAVHKVASIGFGTAYCLASGSVYKYQSPYQFKTDGYYDQQYGSTMALGAGHVYITSASADSWSLDAIDVHTGAPSWHFELGAGTFRTAMPTEPTFDPVNQVVYVGTVNAAAVPPGLAVLDARSGNLVGHIPFPGVGSGLWCVQPALHLSRLVVQDMQGFLFAYDTVQLNTALAAGQTPSPLWRVQSPVPSFGLQTLMIARDSVWVSGASDMDRPFVTVAQLSISDGTLLATDFLPHVATDSLPSPVLGTHVFVENQSPFFQERPAVLIVSVAPDSGGHPQTTAFAFGLNQDGVLQTGTDPRYIWSQGLSQPYLLASQPTWSHGVLYFVTAPVEPNVQGQECLLNALDVNSQPLPGSPWKLPPIASSKFGLAIPTPLVTVAGASAADDVIVVPTYPSGLTLVWPGSGAMETLDTQETVITSLTLGSDGVLYAGGGVARTDGIWPGQVFAIRMNAALQAQRDFIIESELLQDFDDPAGGPGTGPAVPVARYQTHVSIVDDTGNARPFTPVKIWSDAPTTIQINGASFKIGPSTPAVTDSGFAGSLAIVSDATALSTTPLRFWAPFMDPLERIITFPDQLFHRRMATSTIADNTDDDPDKINLATARTYQGSKLFDKLDDATTAAHVIQGLTLSSGLDKSPGPMLSSALLGRPAARQSGTSGVARHALGSQRTAYIAYEDLPGVASFVTDVPAQRPLAPTAATGLTVTAQGGATFVSVPDAQEWGDTLHDPPPVMLGGFFDWLNDLGNDIENGITQIVQFGTTVIDDIANGAEIVIQYVVNKVTYVLRAVLNTIEDLVACVAAFFVKLGKIIEEVIQAIALLIGILEHIPEVANALMDYFNSEITSVQNAITNGAIPKINQGFNTAEKAINTQFNTWISDIGHQGSLPLNGQSGSGGGTAHAAFTVGPPGGQKKSYAVRCMYPIHKLGNYLLSHARQPVGVGAQRLGVNPLADFWTTFDNQIKSDSVLASAWDQVKASLVDTFPPSSLSDLGSTLLVDFLEIIKALAITAMSVVNALLDGFLKAAADLINWFQNDILNYELDIPILSGIYQYFMGDEPTLLGVISLVLAIPLTLLYYVIHGSYPQFSTGGAALSEGRLSDTFDTVVSIGSGVMFAISGWVGGLNDCIEGASEDLTKPLLDLPAAAAALCSGVSFLFGTMSLLTSPANDSAWDWAIWGLSFIPIGLNLCPIGQIGSVVGCCLALPLILVYVGQWKNDNPAPTTLTFVSNILGDIPGIVNPFKYVEDVGPPLVAGVDVLCGFAACGTSIAGAFTSG